jgi:hypothetical protein
MIHFKAAISKNSILLPNLDFEELPLMVFKTIKFLQKFVLPSKV